VTEVEQVTQELRVSSNTDGPWQWLAGVFYSDTERLYGQTLPTPGYDAVTDAVLGAGTSDAVRNGIAPVDSPFASRLPYDLEQIALFGEVSFDATERLQLTAGGRFYDYEEVRSIIFGGLFATATNQVDETSSDGFTPRFLVSYDINDDVTINGQVSQGFRLGGVNDPLNAALCDPGDLVTFGGFQSYEDETLWNYEAGVKARLGDSVQLNAAAFYADIEDLQVTLDAGSCSSRISFNVPDAHSAGVEFELTAQPTNAFRFSLAGSLLEAEFDTTVMDSTGAILGGVQDGNRLASVPEVQGAATATYSFPLRSGASEGYVSGILHYVGDRITQPSDQVPGAGVFMSGLPFGGATGNETTVVDLELDDYTTLNLTTGIINDSWEAALYINNLTDENADLSFDRERGGRARLSFRTNQPRTIGLTFRKSY